MPGGPVAAGGGINASGSKNKLAGIAMTAFAAFGGILFGYDTGTIAGIKQMPDWLRKFGVHTTDTTTYPLGYYLPSSRESLVVSILSAGTFFGALLGAPVADILGRRIGIMVSCLVFSLGVALQTGSNNLATFVVGRVFAGGGVGLVSTLIPMYQSECSPKWIRGAVVAGYQWAITIGLLLASVINNATKNRPNHSAWQIPISIQFIWAFILTLGMFYLPESPRWLIKKGRDEAAARALSRLTSLPPDDPEVETELNDIRAALAEEQKLGDSTYIDCFRFSDNKIFLRTMSGILIQAWQQLTGINFIFYYGTTFFQNSGIKNPFLISVATNIVNCFMTLPGMWGIERFGRRSLLLYGAVVMCICEFIVAIVGVTISVENQSGQQALIALVCIYIAAFASTWGPIAWVICGEIFPLNIRAKAMSLSAASNWLWNFGIGYATPYLVNSGPGNADLGVKVFFIWGSTCAGCVIFTYFCIPETKGLSLEQVDLLYQNSTPITSVRYREEIIAQDVHVSDIKQEAEHHDEVEKV
ncbi:MFS monosaccharide transporter [Dichomitus squalens]|uniref:MFS monosaccharide transporter n=1 Tax=Dichomitus squalens TaxID=114155 RepID=A0A4Q9MIC2_9APHY|nr:MFS monosaccharide transporter [Dichomitus squalens LYAD-421 SS1]EJF64135.1 MFS monosaccharide transporter [Dichomitus squalens LYAD-421 SS1]TBU27260.1 MFS monosaccharide transporter [Dichomitus squalens]TBU44011.1 MFS monosaccharide transporter [Dichomitus squalens]TBU54690.1 MFS monosaccharide transporter [Dichomitus squalens]